MASRSRFELRRTSRPTLIFFPSLRPMWVPIARPSCSIPGLRSSSSAIPRMSYSRKIVGFSISYQSIRGALASTEGSVLGVRGPAQHAILITYAGPPSQSGSPANCRDWRRHRPFQPVAWIEAVHALRQSMPHGPGANLDLTAVVTVTDDGGSSGRLRRDFAMLPPGDIRNCLVALSEDEATLSRLFQYRFDAGKGLKGP